MTTTGIAALCFAAGLLLGRIGRARPTRVSSSSLFHRRPDLYPVMQRWDADVIRNLRRK